MQIRKRKLLLCLPISPHEIEQANALAKLWADLEVSFNENITVLIATRFDLEPSNAIDPSVLFSLKKKFNVITKRVEKVGTGWPAGCNALEIGAYEWFVEENRAKKIDFEYMFIAEPDTVPLRRGWVNEIMEEAYASNCLISGAYFTHDDGVQHINGNCVIHRDFWRACKSIWLCPSRTGWDVHIGNRATEIGNPSKLIWQDYRLGTATNPWKGDDFIFEPKVHGNKSNPLYGVKLQPAMIHGVKTMDGINAVRKRIIDNNA